MNETIAIHDQPKTVEANDSAAFNPYSLTPCYAHEFASENRILSRDELLALLNRLVEESREGVRAVRNFAGESDDPDINRLFRIMAIDRARFRDLLINHIKRLNGVPPRVMGCYYERANAITNLQDRCAFLYHRWRRIAGMLREALPGIADPALAVMLPQMLKVGDRNITKYGSLLEARGVYLCDHWNR